MSKVVAVHELRLIGPFAIIVAGKPARVDLLGKKARALLAFLAMQPQFTASRERLADLLWPNNGDSAARHSLRQCLVTLKKELGAAAPTLLTADSRQVCLNAEGLTVDLHQLALAARQSDTAFDPAAAKLKEGDILEGLTLDSEPFDAWIEEQREQLQMFRTTILKAAVAHFLRSGNLAGAIDAAEGLCRADSTREDWLRQLLPLYAQRDGREQALARARKWLANFKREIGAEPETATVALIEQMKGPLETVASAPQLPDTGAAAGVVASLVPAVPEATPQPEPTAATAADDPEQRSPSVPSKAKHRHSRLGWLWQGSHAMRIWLMTAAGGGIAIVLSAAVILTLIPRVEVAADVSHLVDDDNYVMIRHSARIASAADRQALQLCDQVGRQLARMPDVKVLSPSAMGQSQKVALFSLDCDADSSDAGVSLVLTDNVDGVRVWDADVNATERSGTDPVQRAAREMSIGMTQAVDRHPGYAVDESTKLVRQARAAQYRGPTAANHELALRLYEQALALDPNSRAATLGVAGELIFTRNNTLRDERASLDRAEQLLMRALADDPNSVLGHLFFGVLQENLGQYDAAVRALQRALELSPGNPLVYGQLGHALVLKGNYSAGLGHIRTAMRISPNDILMPVWCVFAGEAELELGHLAVATDWFVRAMTLSPDYVRARGWLAAAYVLDGNSSAAARAMKEFRRRTQLNSMSDLDMMLTRVPDAGIAHNRPRLLQGLQLAAKASGL